MSQCQTNDPLAELLQRQLTSWPLAAANYAALENVQCREVKVEGVEIRLQFNPARAASTGAKVDAESISRRPCFLCHDNRPQEQLVLNEIPGYETLVNPFPIFPRHFTVASLQHLPQQQADFSVMTKLAHLHPGYVVFYNGARAGASAPDHLHFQMGNLDFLPLCRMMQKMDCRHTPMRILICDDPDPTDATVRNLISASGADIELCNILMWSEGEKILTAVFPRRCHRPKCYYADGEERMMISPGAVDMAGVLILPRLQDYERLTAEQIASIYHEV